MTELKEIAVSTAMILGVLIAVAATSSAVVAFQHARYSRKSAEDQLRATLSLTETFAEGLGASKVATTSTTRTRVHASERHLDGRETATLARERERLAARTWARVGLMLIVVGIALAGGSLLAAYGVAFRSGGAQTLVALAAALGVVTVGSGLTTLLAARLGLRTLEVGRMDLPTVASRRGPH